MTKINSPFTHQLAKDKPSMEGNLGGSETTGVSVLDAHPNEGFPRKIRSGEVPQPKAGKITSPMTTSMKKGSK